MKRNKKEHQHIKDTERDHKNPSYQTKRQNLRQGPEQDRTSFKREELGFTNRDTRGYDKQHKGKY